MECPAASELMSLRLDDALSGDEIRALEAHLAVCAHCSVEWEQMQRACAPFVGMAMAEPPAHFTLRVMERVQRRRRRLVWAKTGLSLLLVGLILTTLLATPLRALLGLSSTGGASLVSLLVGTLSGVTAVLGTVWRAILLVIRSILASPTWLLGLAYLAVCVVVAVGWARVALLPRRVD